MTQTPDPSPYDRLGVAPDAGFDAVQAAKEQRLAELGDDDPIARARIEAAYDAVLMERLKERQQGKVSTAARSASQREQATPPPKPVALPSLPQVPLPRLRLQSPSFSLPQLALAEGFGLWFPLGAIGGLALLALVLPAAPQDLLLSLAVLGCVVSLKRRHGRLLAAAGWSLGLLVLGLVCGGLLVSASAGPLPLGLPLSPAQIESLPAFLLLLVGALLIG